jgi:Xaa-Pro dipeptidase
MTSFAPQLAPKLQALLDAETPHFSKAELDRRRAALTGIMEKAGARHILLSGGDRKGSATQWLTEWPTTSGHFVIFTPGERDVLYVKNPNNAALARILSPQTEVGWGAEGSQELAIRELLRRGAKGQKVGILGSYGHSLHEKLVAVGITPVDLGRAYTRLRLTKSEEELDWLRIGCELTDLGVMALEREVQPGMSEHQLADIIERAYMPYGGATQIHYTGVTSMTNPECCVPSQIARNRRVRKGDIVFTEIAASFWSYPGQIQRSIAVQSEPTQVYADLHAVAEEAYHAIFNVLKPGVRPEAVYDAAACIARKGFTICDDLVHGYGGGGYLPPILGTRERPSGPLPDMVFEENMTVVIQPSVMTLDEKAGVQTGELVLVTKNGAERLHRAPMGFRRA